MSLFKWCCNKIYVAVMKFQLKMEINHFRRLGKKYGLPSLDAYTDEKIVEGIKQYRKLYPHPQQEKS